MSKKLFCGNCGHMMAEAFLDRVILHDKFHVEIVWSFADVMEEVRREVEG